MDLSITVNGMKFPNPFVLGSGPPLFYEDEEDGTSAHLEKIVVAERFRKKGVADGLMRELFNRLRATGVKTVTTGFFRPEFFYAYGFAIEKRYAGLVKNLE